MTPAQVDRLAEVHNRVNGGSRDGGGHLKKERVHVNADQAPAILAALAGQRLPG